MKKRWTPKTIRALARKLRDPDSHPNSLGKLELGIAVGVHRNTLSNWMNGRHSPAPAQAELLDSVAKTHSFDPTKVR